MKPDNSKKKKQGWVTCFKTRTIFAFFQAKCDVKTDMDPRKSTPPSTPHKVLRYYTKVNSAIIERQNEKVIDGTAFCPKGADQSRSSWREETIDAGDDETTKHHPSQRLLYDAEKINTYTSSHHQMLLCDVCVYGSIFIRDPIVHVVWGIRGSPFVLLPEKVKMVKEATVLRL
uniref:Uncharacterized protein n=1 Tax=Anopheles atroparvus TaxID=41427 RepID=A0AAG5D965_ANOAO